MEFDEDMLVKVGLFLLVQALVYFILSKSSAVFSDAAPARSFSFKRARTLSIRRMMAALADLPAGGEPYYPIPPKDFASSSSTSFKDSTDELERKS
nr:hypothetical protein CQW23_02509 [Ipomoea trifida]GMD62230.1 hypothetical protein CQW23_02509 [Ipomoea batatas]GME16223.1 hypothetical protein CQW23_02509 [Ipomoea batatas]